MAFVVRIPVAGQLRSWCSSRTSTGGELVFVPLALTAETVVLVSVTEYGDLCSYAMLSRACRSSQRVLACSMTLARNYKTLTLVSIDQQPLGACSMCSGYGDDLTAVHSPGLRIFPCDLCEDLVCEHCVVLAQFANGDVHPSRWRCSVAHEGEEDDLVYTADAARSWLFDVADVRMRAVVNDFDFVFFIQIITLSGEVVRDEQQRPCPVIRTSWDSSFDRVWGCVYHATGGRILQMAIGDASVSDSNRAGVRWTQFLTRCIARAYSRESPVQVTVVLRGWF